MQNKDVFEQKLKESSEIRYEINEKWRAKHLNVLARTFKRIFNRKTSDFRIVKDAIHYKGGYPLPSSPPKMDELLDNFAAVIKFYDLMGNKKARAYLKRVHNIEISDLLPLKDTNLTKYKLDKELGDMIPELVKPHQKVSTKVAAQLIFAKADEIQGVICGLSDKIKYDNASAVQSACGISKSDFKKAVQLDYTAIKKDDNVDEDVKKLHEEVDVAKEGLDIVKKLNEKRTGKIHKKKITIFRAKG